MAPSQTREPRSSQFSVKPITSTDNFPKMAQLKRLAFQSNPLNRALYPMDSPDTMDPWMIERERLVFYDDLWGYLAVVDNDRNDELAAWAKFKLPNTCPSNERIKKEKREQVQNGGSNPTVNLVGSERSWGLPPLPEGFNVELQNEFRIALKEMKDKHFDPYHDFYIQSLSTHPEYQRKGCASALLLHVMNQADEKNARIYLEATGSSRYIYRKYGWKDVEVRGLDLAKYGGEGKYPIYGMMRDPVPSAL